MSFSNRCLRAFRLMTHGSSTALSSIASTSASPSYSWPPTRDRGHRMFGDRVTASAVRFASALGRLAERGELLKKYSPATGAWAPQEVTYWARPPAPTSYLTWAEWCEQQGRSPEWTPEDRAGLGR